MSDFSSHFLGSKKQHYLYSSTLRSQRYSACLLNIWFIRNLQRHKQRIRHAFPCNTLIIIIVDCSYGYGTRHRPKRTQTSTVPVASTDWKFSRKQWITFRFVFHLVIIKREFTRNYGLYPIGLYKVNIDDVQRLYEIRLWIRRSRAPLIQRDCM